MNVENFMIGDWVMVRDFPMNPAPRKMKPEYYLRSLVKFEPIPLSEEILIKNFGEKRAKGGFFYHFIGEQLLERDYILEYYRDGEFGFCRDHGGLLCIIKYVHQLQQILRLLGIKKEIIL